MKLFKKKDSAKQIHEVFRLTEEIQEESTFAGTNVAVGFVIGVIAEKYDAGLLSRKMADSLAKTAEAIGKVTRQQLREGAGDLEADDPDDDSEGAAE